MKKLIIMSALVMGGLGIKTADAQFGIRINLHLGARPVYVPAPQPVVVDEQPVYDNDDYYYLPEVDAYYSIGEQCYYYQDGDRWVSAAYLPGRYHDFDWRMAKHYEVHANRPYMHNDVYRSRFGRYADRNDYYARAYQERGHYDNDAYRNRDQYDNRGRDEQNHGYDRNDNRNQGGYAQQNQGGYNQQNQGNYNQPSQGRNQGGYNQPQQGRNQGGYNQGGSQQHPAQGMGQQGNRGNGQQGGQPQNNGNSQPTNHNGGQNNGNYTGGEHYTANKMGVVPDHADFARPVRF